MGRTTYYRKDIDGLRGIAVLSVVLYHAFPKALPGGFMGVDIFFVLSGFLISNILLEQLKTGAIDWRAFYRNRIRRIFPALALVLASALVFGYFLLFPDEYRLLGKQILASAGFMGNILQIHDAGYFDKASELKPMLHLWSLGIEEQFYLVWPLLLYLVYRFRANLPVVLCLFTLLSFGMNVALTAHHQVAAFYLPLTRFWELSLGGIAAYLVCHRARAGVIRQIPFQDGLGLLAMAVLAAMLVLPRETSGWPGMAAAIPVLCAAVLLGTESSFVNRKVLPLRILTFTGLISYPLYLWHWELLSFARIVFAGEAPLAVVSGIVILSVLLAIATWRFLEVPIRFGRFAQSRVPAVVPVLCAALLMAGVAGLGVKLEHGFPGRGIAAQQKGLLEDIKGFDAYRQRMFPCSLGKEDASGMTWCLQARQGTPDRIVWGDSHADHLLAGLAKADPDHNWLLLGQTGCPPLLGVDSFWKGEQDRCVQANAIILRHILANPAVKTVVLSSLGPFYISDTGVAAVSNGKFAPTEHILGSAEDRQKGVSRRVIFEQGLSRTIRALQSAGKKVILFQDTPEIPFFPERCIRRPLAPERPCTLSYRDVVARQGDYVHILQRQAGLYGIRLYNPLPEICDRDVCHLAAAGHLLFRDSHHLSIAGSERIVAGFLAATGSLPT